METKQEWKIGDCLELLKEVPDNNIDLVVTSPPYDDLRTYGGFSFNFEAIVQQLFRVVKKGGVVVWVVGDATKNGSESGTSFKQALYFKEIGFNLHDTMIYLKHGFANPSSNRYHQVFEYMFIFSKVNLKTFNPLKDRKNKYSKRGGDIKRQKNGNTIKGNGGGEIQSKYGMRYNIWDYKIGGGNISNDSYVHNHPAPFPYQLAKDHIISWSNEGDVVMDPFLGSGTTLKACQELNRNGIGFEINPEYETIIKQRLRMNDHKLTNYF